LPIAAQQLARGCARAHAGDAVVLFGFHGVFCGGKEGHTITANAQGINGARLGQSQKFYADAEPLASLRIRPMVKGWDKRCGTGVALWDSP
jgi:hypothetical protein